MISLFPSSIHVMIHSYDSKEESVVELEAGWKNMALKLGEKARDVIVRPQDPATFLIYHTDREDYNRKDRFILDVDSKMDGTSENYCMIVSVYNQECPLHNKPGNVKVLFRSIFSNSDIDRYLMSKCTSYEICCCFI